MTRAILLALLAGCAATTSYVYAPRDASTSQDGYPASIVRIPSGSVELVSYGISDSELHLKMAIENDSDATPWTFVPADQLIEMAKQPLARPVRASSGPFTAAAGERLTVDLYYALPPGVVTEDDLSGFDLSWRVGTHEARTHFERIEESKVSYQLHPVYKRSEEPYWY